MARTESTMLPLGTLAPNFDLIDVLTDSSFKLTDQSDYTATVVMFICNHCPYVKHINEQLVNVANRYLLKNIRFIAISSNDASTYPDDSPENMKISAKELNYPFPYLYDESQEVAKAYNAACTPDFYIFNQKLALVYRGQFDDSRPGKDLAVTGESISHALDCLIHNKKIDFDQKPSLGCNIKWKEN